MTKNWTYSVETTVSIKDVYNREIFECPQGYKIVAFRPPEYNEQFLVVSDMSPSRAMESFSCASPRLIIKPIKRYVFEETGETRSPKVGEYFLAVDLAADRVCYCTSSMYYPAVPILRKVE